MIDYQQKGAQEYFLKSVQFLSTRNQDYRDFFFAPPHFAVKTISGTGKSRKFPNTN